jgi:hypothetical protein
MTRYPVRISNTLDIRYPNIYMAGYRDSPVIGHPVIGHLVIGHPVIGHPVIGL